MPDRGVDRPPFPDEIQQARRYATRLRQAHHPGTQQIDKRTPGGRFDGRAYARGQAQRAAGRPVSSHPWQITRQVRAPIEAPHVGLVIDTSGSMSAYEYALGPIAWILTNGLRQIGGRCASALFGNGAELLADGAAPAAARPRDRDRRRHRVRRRRDRARLRAAGDGQPAPPALPLCALRRRLGRHPGRRAEDPLARRARRPDHPPQHRIAPLSVECDRITVITDPADALDHVAADTVAALRAARAPRRPH